MSYSRLSMKTGIHLSKLKRIFSGRQMIRLDDYLTIINSFGVGNTLTRMFPDVNNSQIRTTDLNHQIVQASENVHPYGLAPDRAFS